MVKRQATRGLTIREFLHDVREQTLERLPTSLGATESRVVFSSLQLHFGEPRLHYEVWPVRKTGRVEIGLHIEGPEEWSRTVAAALGARADELRAALDDGYELEDWTASWCRLHRTLPLTRLDEAMVGAVSAALVELVQATRPIITQLDLPAAPATQAGRSEGRRRRFKRNGGGRARAQR